MKIKVQACDVLRYILSFLAKFPPCTPHNILTRNLQRRNLVQIWFVNEGS